MTPNNSIKKIISSIKSELKGLYPENEINSFIFLIFEEILNLSRTKLLISENVTVNNALKQKIDNIIVELKANKPIQYILGSTTFYDLEFRVKKGILIPRPETEELVDWIIKENHGSQLKILDIGTGSGCIAISLSKNLPNSIVYAADISDIALTIVKENSELNQVNILTKKLDILNPDISFNDKFDVIVSNPPYVRESEKKLMHQNVLDYEPELALFVSDNDPLLFYKSIINFGMKHLNRGGKIYFEINEAFGKETAFLFKESNFKDIVLKQDINGKDRMLRGIK